jgi:hypothetical protein
LNPEDCFTTALLLLYYCFTTALLLLYYWQSGTSRGPKSLLNPEDCFTTALLLLYYCFTTALLLAEWAFSRPEELVESTMRAAEASKTLYAGIS